MDLVVITGASAGIGRALAREFGRRRARVGLLARGVEGLEGVKREIELLGGEALVIPTDVSDAEQVERAADRVESTFGPIDLCLHITLNRYRDPLLAAGAAFIGATLVARLIAGRKR